MENGKWKNVLEISTVFLFTYREHAEQPDWRPVVQHHCLPCKCKRRLYDDRHSRWTECVSAASLRLLENSGKLQKIEVNIKYGKK